VCATRADGAGAGGGSTLADSIASSGLVAPGTSGLLLLSGGADSCALAFGLAGLDRPVDFCALHLNYGLRPDSGEDEAACITLCRRLGIELVIERPVRPKGASGNLHAWAREQRYGAAEALRRERGLDWVAVAHTASDLAETVIYRLAVSPGTRPLAAMPARRGAVIRPLLALSRETVRAEAERAGLPFVDDLSNDDPAFARARIRNEVLPVLADLNPSVLEAIDRTRGDLVEELDFLELAGAELAGCRGEPAGGAAGASRIEASRLAAAHPAVRRFALRSMAEQALGRPVPLSREQTSEAVRLASDPEGGRIDLGQGASLVAEAGTVTVDPGPGPVTRSGPAPSRADDGPPVPEPGRLALPGRLEWGGWTVVAEPMTPPFVPDGPAVATLDQDLLGSELEVRAWRPGDRISPLGLDGSKSLQDLFTDHRFPRSGRRRLPLLVAGGEIAWVPGLAVADRFRLTSQTRRAIRFEVVPGARTEP
jgi:tRNA(Ile)-lysidine synthase